MWLSLFCSPVHRGSARASTGFFRFPSKSGWAQNKGSRLGKRSCSVCRGCHPSQPAAGNRARPGRARREDRSASRAGRVGEPGHSHVLHTHPHLCPALLVLIPLGISENSCWTPFFMDLRAGSREGLEQPCAWQGTRGSAVLLPLGKTLCFWPPPNLPVLIVSSCMGRGVVSQEIWDCCTPRRRLSQVKSHPSVVPPGTAGLSCQKSSPRPGTGVWWAHRD